mgnify:CR=1 FL=1
MNKIGLSIRPILLKSDSVHFFKQNLGCELRTVFLANLLVQNSTNLHRSCISFKLDLLFFIPGIIYLFFLQYNTHNTTYNTYLQYYLQS